MPRPPKHGALSKDEIGRRVRALRNERGLSQTELAKRLGLAQTNISAIERGDRGVTIHQAVKLARALGATTDEILSGAGPRQERGRRRPGDRRFLRRLELIEKLSKSDKQALLRTIDAFVLKVS